MIITEFRLGLLEVVQPSFVSKCNKSLDVLEGNALPQSEMLT